MKALSLSQMHLYVSRMTKVAVGAIIGMVVVAGSAKGGITMPHISQPLVPTSGLPGGPGFTLTLNGAGFGTGSVVNWNGSARATHWVSKTQLTATILASDIATPGAASVTVFNPSPGGGTSNVAYFQITGPAPTLVLSRADQTTQSSPRSVAVADLDGNGTLDMVVANEGADSVEVFLGNGDGTFQPGVPYSTLSGPFAVTVGDFNQDGRLDLAVACNGSGMISLLFGNGDGTFQPAVSVNAGASPTSVSAADFNRDGKLDLVVTNFAYSTVSVLLNNGGGTFQSPVTYSTGSGPISVVAEDFNGDGKIDLAVANNGDGTLSLLLGNGDGTFQPALPAVSTGIGPISISAADFNGDRKLDLAVVNSGDNTISILLGNGDGTFQPAVPYATGITPASVAIADLNGDGKLDLATANNADATLSVLVGNGDGTFQPALGPFTTGLSPISVAVGDFNDDGSFDLAVADFNSSTVSVFLQAPSATLSPASLSFGNQAISTSSTPQTATLTNTGSGLLVISSIAMKSGNPSDFTQTNTCGASVTPGASCTISVTFTPNAEGALSTQLTVTDNYIAQGPQIVSLSGTGLAPLVSLSPGSLSFGNQNVGTTSSPQTVTLTNTGNAALAVSGVATSGDFAQTNTCGSSVEAGNSCTINVTFTPKAEGTRTGQITITDNASSGTQRVTLTGTGLAPLVSLSPTSLNFGSLNVGATSSPQSVALSNTGNASLAISSISVTGDPADYVQTNTCASSVAAGSSCSITVTFTPKAEGTRTAHVNIADNAGSGTQLVTLTGTGLAPIVSLSPTSLSFGNQGVGITSSPQTVTLTNTGNAALSISGISASGDFAQTSNCGSSLAAAGSCTISATFTPTTTGTRKGQVTITDNAGGGTQTVSLSGTGLGPSVSLSPASLTFATQVVGTTSSSQTVTLNNTGAGVLTITSITATAAFSETNTCGSTVQPGQHCTISVTFTPTVKGPATGSVTATDSASPTTQKVSLTGTGTVIRLSPNSLNFGNQPVNKQSNAKTITLTNVGTAAVAITSISITGTNPGDFAQTSTCGSSISGGASCTISVTFTPMVTGARSASVSVSDFGGGSPQTAALSGTGT